MVEINDRYPANDSVKHASLLLIPSVTFALCLRHSFPRTRGGEGGQIVSNRSAILGKSLQGAARHVCQRRHTRQAAVSHGGQQQGEH